MGNRDVISTLPIAFTARWVSSGPEEVFGPAQGRGQEGVRGWGGSHSSRDVFPERAVWLRPVPVWLVLFPGEGMAGGARGKGRITFGRGAVGVCVLSAPSPQCPGGPGRSAPCIPVRPAQPPADLRSRHGARQHPAPSPLALHLPRPVAQSMVLVKMRKYLYKNNLKNMVCQIIKAAEHPRSFQLDWETQCCFLMLRCSAGGARGQPSHVQCWTCQCGFTTGLESSLKLLVGWLSLPLTQLPAAGASARDRTSPGSGFSLVSWFWHCSLHWDCPRSRGYPWVKCCVPVLP